MGAKYVIGVLMVACSFPGLFLTLNSKFDSDSLISLAILSFFALSGIFLMRENTGSTITKNIFSPNYSLFLIRGVRYPIAAGQCAEMTAVRANEARYPIPHCVCFGD